MCVVHTVDRGPRARHKTLTRCNYKLKRELIAVAAHCARRQVKLTSARTYTYTQAHTLINLLAPSRTATAAAAAAEDVRGNYINIKSTLAEPRVESRVPSRVKTYDFNETHASQRSAGRTVFIRASHTKRHR